MLFWVIVGAIALVVIVASLLGGSKQLHERRADTGAWESELHRTAGGDGGINSPRGWL